MKNQYKLAKFLAKRTHESIPQVYTWIDEFENSLISKEVKKK